MGSLPVRSGVGTYPQEMSTTPLVIKFPILSRLKGCLKLLRWQTIVTTEIEQLILVTENHT